MEWVSGKEKKGQIDRVRIFYLVDFELIFIIFSLYFL
jgi:hypothetical protein